MPRRWLFGVLLAACLVRATAAGSIGGENLPRRLDEVAARAGGGRVGIAAAILGTGETVARDGHGRYPMQSVYKLPIAMAVLHAVDAGSLELNQLVRVEPDEFISERQHSPLRDAHPDGVTLTLHELLRLAVAESDGTASDVLLRVLGGSEHVMEYLGQLGIEGIRVLDTEQTLGRDDAAQYLNWATPAASVELLRALYQGEALAPTSRALVLRWMTETGTGRQRLKALLPVGASVAHKTGTSGTTGAGLTAATNDIGLITMPDGRVIAIAVYVCDSPASQAVRERVIAETARAVYEAVAESRTASGRWQRDGASLAWTVDDRVVWRFVFDPSVGKPFFHPLGPVGGPDLTEMRPADHRWHYGLWFSWKFINGANYWEEDGTTGLSEGRTRWALAEIETRDDGSAVIRLDLSYVHPSGREDLSERREIRISAPSPQGGYAIDWRSSFTAGGAGVLLDRTPMPGEPGGQPWGGYGGLGIRFIGQPTTMTPLTFDGPIARFVDDRARPVSAAVGANFARDGIDLGGIAVINDPANELFAPGAPWYLVRSSTMNFLSAAVLAPRPLSLAAGAEFSLRYRILVSSNAWTVEALRAAVPE